MLTEIGLLIITIAWLIQFNHLKKEDQSIKISFVLVYAFGVAIIIIDGILNKLYSIAFFNILSFLSAICLLKRIKK